MAGCGLPGCSDDGGEVAAERDRAGLRLSAEAVWLVLAQQRLPVTVPVKAGLFQQPLEEKARPAGICLGQPLEWRRGNAVLLEVAEDRPPVLAVCREIEVLERLLD